MTGVVRKWNDDRGLGGLRASRVRILE